MEPKRGRAGFKYQQIPKQATTGSPPTSLIEHYRYEQLTTAEEDELDLMVTAAERRPLMPTAAAYASYAWGPRVVPGPKNGGALSGSLYPSFGDSGFGDGSAALPSNGAMRRFKVSFSFFTSLLFPLLPRSKLCH